MHLARLKFAWPRSTQLRRAYIEQPCSRLIHTVHRPSLSSTDYIDLSGHKTYKVPCPGRDSSGFAASYDRPARFPSGSAGFFYYDPVDPAHPVCGQLRFRVTGSPDPATFEDGHDLLSKDGRVWTLPLPSISRSAKYMALAKLLVAEGLVTQQAMNKLAELRHRLRVSSQIISSGQRTFVGQFAHLHWHVRVARGTELHTVIMRNPLVDELFCNTRSPYKGSALFLLEPHTTEHGRAAFHMRVKKVLEPAVLTAPGYNHYVPAPEEGELLSHKFGEVPWRNHATEGGAGLQHLLTSQDQGHVTRVSSHGLSEQTKNLCYPSVRTLRPDRLKTSDFVDLSGRTIVQMSLADSDGDSHHRFTYTQSKKLSQKRFFPIGSHGFLYCHTVDGQAQEIRFRVTPSDDPRTFSAGRDMELPSGLPWSIHMGSLTSGKPGLARMLVTDGYLDPAAVRMWRAIPFKLNGFFTIISMGQLFSLNFSSPVSSVWLTWNGQLHRLRPHDAFRDHRRVAAPPRPYAGSAWCHFELADSGHANSEVVLRVVKIVDPVVCTVENYDGHTRPPVEGGLVQDCAGAAWTLKLDKALSFPIRA